MTQSKTRKGAPKYFMPPGETDPLKGHFQCIPQVIISEICPSNNAPDQKHVWTKADEATGRAKCALCDAVEVE